MSARGAVLRPNDLPAIDRGGGARTVPLVVPRVGSTSILNGITSFPPGASIPMHSHNCEESVLVLEGECLAVMDGVEHRLHAHEATFIPADVPHRFINASNTDPAKIFWTYASINASRTMIETGQTHPILAEHSKARET